MTSPVLPGNPPVPLVIRRAARARRISLRVSALDGRVTLSLPPRARLAEGLAFAREREGWIRAALGGAPEARSFAPGEVIPFEGRPHRLDPAPVPRVTLAEGRILVPSGPGIASAAFARRVADFLRQSARSRLEKAATRHATALGRRHAGITLRDTRSRWGSCTSEGRLMFSWRLVLAPPEVLDYVAAHEAAHLVHMDHSPAFWAEVARLLPDHATHRRWLREHGPALHAWRVAPGA